MPVSIINFIEGTRYSDHKRLKQKSPFKKLLRPKAGGIGFVMSAMGGQLSYILNVTIRYQDGVDELWGFLCGKGKRVQVNVEKLPITEELLGHYSKDIEYRKRFQKWLNDLWSEKDKRLVTPSI